jgi:2-oxoglutarate ferredoxin oxidoreductase subunit beta
VIDVLQPCVSFNRVNTFAWYKKRCRELGAEHDASDWSAAMKVAVEWGDTIPIGVIYENDRPPFESLEGVLAKGTLVGREVDRGALAGEMMRIGGAAADA